MVVDDSLILRGLISRMVNEDPAAASVVASAANGQIAVERAKQGDIDVVILDIEMPVMDGLTALPLLLAIDPKLVIIMASTLTTRNAEISFKAMAAGAKDYLPKPSAVTPGAGSADFKRELLEKIRVLGARYRRPSARALAPTMAPAMPATRLVLRPVALSKPLALAIGASTGGPNALQQFLKSIPAPLKVPIFITQHMPPTFTALLADNLSRETGHQCAEARDGEPVLPGRVYIAPGDHHMTIVREGAVTVVRLNQDAKEGFCRPAVDPMLRSLTATYQRQLLVVMLTGMGQDGLLGSEGCVKGGANLIAQDEESSVVWGMPGAVARAGICCGVLPLGSLGPRVLELLGR